MAIAYPNPDTFDTFPKLLRMRANATPKRVALRGKEFGIWHPITWQQYQNQVVYLALFMASRGLGKGDVFAMLGNNNQWWVSSELAAQAAGCMSMGLYRDSLETEVDYLLGFSKTKGIFAEEQEQIDKLLSLGKALPDLKLIIYEDPRGLKHYDDPRLVSLKDALAQGEALHEKKPDGYNQMIDAISGDDVAILCSTSGTTAHPKLVMLTAKRFIRHTISYLKEDPKDHKDEYVSILPLAWILGQAYDIGFNLTAGMKVNFPENPETAMADLREIGPTYILGAPRLFEEIVADMRSRIMDAPWISRWIFNTCVERGMKKMDQAKKDVLAGVCLFSTLRDRYGFSRTRAVSTGGAPMGPDTFKLFLAMGVPLRQLYGQTEMVGAYTMQKSSTKEVDFVSVGVPFEGVEVKIENADVSGVGEIVSKHENMFVGYYNNEAAFKADVRDGWMHTGDVGYFDDKKRLVVLDRSKDMLTMRDGSRFSPQYIENRLKFSPYIAEAVVFGEGRDYLTAIICIRFSIVSKWAEKNSITYTSYTNLSVNEQVAQLLEGEVEKVNAYLPEKQRVRKFVLLFKELDVDDGEVTHTRKVRRVVVNKRYAQVVETLYGEGATAKIDTEVTFEDGRKARIQAEMSVRRLGDDRGGAKKVLSKAS